MYEPLWWKLARLRSPSLWRADQVRRRDGLIAEETREIQRITAMAKEEVPKKLIKAARQALKDNPEWLKWASASDARQLLKEVDEYCNGQAVQRWCESFQKSEASDPGVTKHIPILDSWTDRFAPRADLVNPLKEIFAAHGCQCDMRVSWRAERLDLFVDRYQERSQQYANARFVLEQGLLDSSRPRTRVVEEGEPEAGVA